MVRGRHEEARSTFRTSLLEREPAALAVAPSLSSRYGQKFFALHLRTFGKGSIGRSLMG
jgi:hypothetical protein